MRQSRRAFLATVGAVGLAGCAGVGGRNDPGVVTPTDGTDAGTDVATGAETDAATSGETDATTAGAPDTGTSTSTPAGRTGTASVPRTDVGDRLEGFEDLEYWYALSDQGTVEPELEGVYAGSQSMRLRASGDDAFAGAFTSFGEPRDFDGKNVSLAVKVRAPAIAKLSVALLAPDESNMVRMTRTFPGPVGTWVRSDMGVTAVRGDPDLSAVQEVRLVARRRDQDDAAIDVSVDDVRLADAPDAGSVTFTFDDTHESHYETAFPLMEEYGFSGVEGVISDAVYRGDRLDVGMMREMSDAGWDMASHPYVGEKLLTESSAAKQRSVIEGNKRFLVDKGFEAGARHFLTPKNMVGPATMRIVRDVHDSLYTFGGMPNGRPATTDYYNSRIAAANTDRVRQYVDYAAEFGQHLVLNHHAIGAEAGEISESDFAALLEYVDGADVNVVTCSDVLAPQGQH
ncbi:polysaccharide deacetylase family protein [Halosimplex salinum]|uniref:polysaccharide deacetylase family protein n=1 Tax=Halosimplex salinum TaxID=1710538 RepID=UPI000F46E8C1|nr:polysaccharide deacetylase family protein [Halosimplex salinum]